MFSGMKMYIFSGKFTKRESVYGSQMYLIKE